jgi:hypothetical protein
MPSPFPGMNPYPEQDHVWSDFHESFMPAARDAIATQVRPHFIAKINKHMFIHEMPDESRRFVGRSDVSGHGRRSRRCLGTLPAAFAWSSCPGWRDPNFNSPGGCYGMAAAIDG